MERNFGDKKMPKRKKERKWSDLETNLLIKFLKEHEFEKPSAKEFYISFIKNHEIKDIHWNIVKNKVRSMKSSYLKATNWLSSSTGAKMLYEGETVNGIVNRLCPHYYTLKKIFSKTKIKGNSCGDDDSTASPVSPVVVQISKVKTSLDGTVSTLNSPLPVAASPRSTAQSQITCNSAGYTHAHAHAKANAPPLDKSTLILLERSAVEKARLSFEEKKFNFEKEKILRELALKEKEIEKDERLKILELESKERVAMRELEYKYKRK